MIQLTPDTTVLELVEYHPETEKVFERYTRRLGICICCEALFCSLREVAKRYELELEELMARLDSVMEESGKKSSLNERGSATIPSVVKDRSADCLGTKCVTISNENK